MRFVRDHSLSLVLLALGAGTAGLAFLFEGRPFDFWLGIAHAFLTTALINLLKGPLVERNREDSPGS